MVEAGSAGKVTKRRERDTCHMPGHATPPLHAHFSHARMLLWLEVATYTMCVYLFTRLNITQQVHHITTRGISKLEYLSLYVYQLRKLTALYNASLVTNIGNQHSEVYNNISQMNISISGKLQEIRTHTNLGNARLDNVIGAVN